MKTTSARQMIIVLSALTGLFSLFACKPSPGPHNPDDRQSAKLLSSWISVQLELVRNTTGVTHVAYSRHFAYTSVAFYEALAPSLQGYASLAGQLTGLNSLPSAPQGNFSGEVSANAAYADMMRSFYSANPANLPIIDSAETAIGAGLTAHLSSSAATLSAGFGKSVAASVLQWAVGDGMGHLDSSYVPPVGPGLWSPTPPAFAKAAAPYWKDNRPMIAGDISRSMPPAPYQFDTAKGSAFAGMVGSAHDSSTDLTVAQKAIADHWDDSPNGKYVTVFGHWASILRGIISSSNPGLLRAAQAYVLMCVAMNDASIVCWKAKYAYNQLRPVSYYMRNYTGDTSWRPYLVTPPHPEYPAAHSSLSFAAAAVLAGVFGDHTSFTDHTYDYLKVPDESFPDFLSAAELAGTSRVYGGIHFRLSVDAGAFIGKSVAEAVMGSVHFNRTGKAGF